VCSHVLGVKYLESCPAQPKIPVYLLVGGSFGLLKIFSLLWQHIRSRRFDSSDDMSDDDDDDIRSGGVVSTSRSSQISDLALTVFLVVWFACGNYWVLSVWRPSHEQPLFDPSNWCDRTVYMFAFIQIIICDCLTAVVGASLALLLAVCYKTELVIS